MKQIKKLLALILALTLMLSLSVTAFADEGDGDGDTSTAPTYDITVVEAKDGHTYTAYQIFAADIAEVGNDKVLSNIIWGSGVTIEGELEGRTASKWAESLNNAEDDGTAAKAFAQKISAYLSTGVASKNGVISDVEPGYYLVKDTTSPVPAGDAVTYYLLQVVNKDVTVSTKVVAPTLEKKVRDNDDIATWNDSADYNIGDTVPFQLTAKVSKTNLQYYTTYKVVFHDTMSAGLTLNEGSFVVTINGTKVEKSVYTVVLTDNGFTVILDDIKDYENKDLDEITIVVTYTATLNSEATIGAAGNPNTAYLEFSNNPNVHTQTGKTPEDKVTVFTFKLVVNKVTANTGDNKNENPYVALNGADFTLYKKVDNDWVNVTELHKADEDSTEDTINPTKTVNDEGTTFTFSGLDAGVYKLSETTTPAGYNTIADILFTITASHELISDDPRLTELGVTGTDADIFTPQMTETTGTQTAVPTGTISGDVINNAGFILPSTGGVGTTLFYVIGAVMVFGAVVMLITKKRMAK